jgi:microcystin-dependent protein
MASVTSFTKERLQEIEDTTVVGGSVNSMGNLILATKDGIQIDAGSVRGLTGDTGPDRPLVAGVIQAFGGSTPPAGWLFCNGAAVSRTVYSELFAAIGTTYGVGDGFLSFNLPDLRGRVPVGFNAADTEFNAMGKTGGEKTHKLTIAEMPAHSHTVSGKAGVDNMDFDGVQQGFAASDFTTPYDQLTFSTGGDQAHNNLQPYNTFHYLISVGNAGAPTVDPENYVGRGSTAQRDALFGLPTDDPTKVALANRKIIWFNTDTNWEESYYATTGKSGLAVPGLVTNASSGWYPTGNGEAPYFLLEGTATTQAVQGTFMGGWSSPPRRRGGAAWFTSANGKFMQIQRHGRYDVRIFTIQQAGTGTVNYHLRVVAADGTTIIRNVDGNAFPLNSALYTRAHMEYEDVILEPTWQVGVFVHSGTLDVHVGSIAPQGQFIIRYLGPPLVTD